MCAYLFLTLCDPMDCSPPGSSVHAVSQARIMEWVALPFSRESSWPRDRTHFSIGWQIVYHCATWEARVKWILKNIGIADLRDSLRAEMKHSTTLPAGLRSRWCWKGHSRGSSTSVCTARLAELAGDLPSGFWQKSGFGVLEKLFPGKHSYYKTTKMSARGGCRHLPCSCEALGRVRVLQEPGARKPLPGGARAEALWCRGRGRGRNRKSSPCRGQARWN